MEQLIILLVIGLIALVKWLFEKAAEARNEPPQDQTTQPTIRRVPQQQESEEERMRRFMEALGIPTDSTPPPPVQRPTPQPPVQRPQAQPRPMSRRAAHVPAPKPPPLVVPEQPRVRPTPGKEIKTPRAAEEVFDTIMASEPRVPEREPEVVVPPSAPVMPSAMQPAIELQPPPAVPEKKPVVAASQLREMMRSRESLRAAFLVREVLGPPVGLQ